jgi:hypothetical protein
MIKDSEKDLRTMMQTTDDKDADFQIRKNIQQTYLYKLQEITRHLRQLEKEHLYRMKDLYGEEGEIILDQLEKREGGYFADIDRPSYGLKQRTRDLVVLEEAGEMAKERDGEVRKVVR